MAKQVTFDYSLTEGVISEEEVKSMDDLKEELSYYSVGSTVELTIMQGSPTGFQAKTVSVTLGAAANAQ